MPRCLFAILILLLSLPTTAGEEESSWQVTEPVGPWRDISIDTETTTWSFVDVSPDGETLVFDMLGDIYSMPIGGGEVTALTSGIEWNFQPAFSPDGQRIAFISDRDGNDNLWLMDLDGSNLLQVTQETRTIFTTRLDTGRAVAGGTQRHGIPAQHSLGRDLAVPR